MRNWLTIACLCAVSFSLVGNKKLANEKITMEKTNHFPQYLYKILSLRNWQATQSNKTVQLSAEDAAFIHFSTQDQLEGIIGKYWTDAPQLVILKIESKKLEGRLVFETNPVGTTKYYHLYDGFIPFSSIVESKIVYQQPIDTCDLQKLAIVQVGHPVLRQVARALSVEEITSPEIQELIETMKATMRAAPGVGLAAPQIGKPLQIVVIEDMDHSHLTTEQLTVRNRYPVPFHVIINPRLYLEESTDSIEFFEGCLSVPEFVGIVPRANSVRVECLNERGEPVVIQAQGWYARILQHEIDHLNGTVYIDKAQLPTLMTTENYVKLYKDKSIKEIQATLFLNNAPHKTAHSTNKTNHQIPGRVAMNHTIEHKKEKFFIGLELRTNNEECSLAMPAHKDRFFKENILSQIPNKINGDILALYTDYEGDHTKPYSWILGCEVSSLEQVPEGLIGKIIPESKYAVYITQGAFPQGLIATWQDIWKSHLPRSYTSDFEVYHSDFDPEHNPKVKVYIAIEDAL